MTIKVQKILNMLKTSPYKWIFSSYYDNMSKNTDNFNLSLGPANTYFLTHHFQRWCPIRQIQESYHTSYTCTGLKDPEKNKDLYLLLAFLENYEGEWQIAKSELFQKRIKK